jgi:hypothetical protein
MKRLNFKMRNAAIGFACLAAVTVFASCESDDDLMDNGADIVSFTFNGIDGTAIIDKDALTVTATAGETVDLTSIVPTFTLSNGATATVNGVLQASGTTANNFTNTVTYVVTSSDGNLINIWKITITGGNSEYHFFGIKQGRVVYSYTRWTAYEVFDDETRILTFDNYGDLMREDELWKNGDDWMRDVTIIDLLAGITYHYYFIESEYPNNPTAGPIESTQGWMETVYHCWKADSWQWGEREDLQIKANQTIAEQICSIFSFKQDGYQYEYGEWNNITMLRRVNMGSDGNELRATSFSTSIPENSFIPYE